MEEREDKTPEGGSKPQDKNKMLMWVLCAIIALLLAIIGWLVWQLQQCEKEHAKLKDEKAQLQEQLDELKGEEPAAAEPAGEQAAACNDTPTDSMKENIKAALDSKNTAAFATYTTNPVKYVLAASEFGGDISPDEAATSLEYTHGATGPWDFNLPAPTLAGYDAGFYTDYFDANTYVGRSTDSMVVAFDFGCTGKIKQIFVAANEDLL